MGVFTSFSMLPMLLLCLASTCRHAFATDGLLDNGNFEQGPDPSDLDGDTVLKPNAIPNWQISGSVEYINATQNQNDMPVVVPEQRAAIRLGTGASIKQSVNVTTNMYYSLTFRATAGNCGQGVRLNVSARPYSGLLQLYSNSISGISSWNTYAWAFLAFSNVVEIILSNAEIYPRPTSCGPMIDLVAIRALHPAPREPEDNLLTNGDFEEGPYIFPNATEGVLLPPISGSKISPLPSWMVESLRPAVKYIDAARFGVPRGRRAVELVGGEDSTIAQVVRTGVGRFLQLTFAVGDANNSCVGPMIVEAFIGRFSVRVRYESRGKGGYKQNLVRFASFTDQIRIAFRSAYNHVSSDGTASICGPVIDDVKVQVPRAFNGTLN